MFLSNVKDSIVACRLVFGFTLISLFEGFIIVSGLNSGLPGWLVALVAIIGVLLGRWSIGVAQQRAKLK